MLKSILIFLMTLPFTLAFANTPDKEKICSSWRSLGRQFSSDPAACSSGNLTFVFARGVDNQIWYSKRFLANGLFKPWKKMPDIIVGTQRIKASGPPAAYCTHVEGNAYESVIVSIVGTDNRVWNIYGAANAEFDDFNGWKAYPSFSAATFSGPALAGWGPDRYHHFVRGADNKMYIKSTVNNILTAVMPTSSRLDFFYRDQLGKLWHQIIFGNSWQPIQPIPGTIYSSPDVVSRDANSLDLFAKGSNNTLVHKRSVNGV
jgi:hypothetical protein